MSLTSKTEPLREKHPGQGFTTNVLMLTSGTTVGRIILFFSFPVITRMYLPEHVGLWQVFLSALFIVQPFFAWGYARAVVLPETSRDAVNVFGVAMTASLISSVILVFGAWGGGDWLAARLGAPDLPSYLWLIPALAVGMGLEQSCLHWLIRRGAFFPVTISTLVRSLLIVGVPILAAWLWQTSGAGLIFGSFIGYSTAGLVLAFACLWGEKTLPLGQINTRSMRKMLAAYSMYPKYVATYSLIAEAGKRLRIFVLAAFTSSAYVGLVAMANEIASAPIFVSGEIRTVFYGMAGREKDHRRLERFVVRLLGLLVVLSTSGFAWFVFNAQTIMTVFLGETWRQAGPFASLLALPAYLTFNLRWLDRMYDIMGRQRLAVVVQIGYDALVLAGFILALALDADAVRAVAVMAALSCAGEIVWIIITFKISRFSLRSLAGPLLWAGISVLGYLAVHIVLGRLFPPTWAPLMEIILIAAFELGYFLVMYKRGSLNFSKPRT